MSTAILYIKNLSGFRNGNITIETQATNGLELAEDIIKSFGNKELKVSDIKIMFKGKPIEISESNVINTTDLASETCLTVLKNK